MKSILAVIGAGEAAFPILKRAQTLDYVTTLAFGQQGSLAQKEADIFVDADIFNIEYIAKTCREYGVNGVIATSEATTEVTAILANMLNLPGNDVSQGFGAKNKAVMRERVANLASIRQPWFRIYSAHDKYDYPVMVKAPDSCGKKGISIARNETELKTAILYSQTYSGTGDVIVEQYLEGGKEYSIECLAGCGLYEVIQYTEKDSSGPPHFVECGHHQPAMLSEKMKDRIQVAVKDVLKAIGIKCGMAHMELKIIDDQIYFIEVGARGGGGCIADTLTVKSTDFDYFKAAIDCCLGIYEHIDVHNVAYTGIYFHCKQNEYLRPVFERAKTADWCIFNNVSSDSFMETTSSDETHRSGYIIYSAKNKIDLMNN